MDEQLKLQNEQGFSLLEVLIAITLFVIFSATFLTSQGYNVSDSELSEQQLMLQQLAEMKINELHLDPPKFQNLTTSGLSETKKFEETEYSNFEYLLELKPLVIPDFSQLFGQQGNVGEAASNAYEGDYFDQTSQRNSKLEQLVFSELKKNVEKIVWQARVTVTNKETKQNFTLSTWITNDNEKVQLNIGI